MNPECLSRIPFLASLDAVGRRALWSRCGWRYSRAGATIRYQGDAATGLLLLLDGVVSLDRSVPSGDRIRLTSLRGPCAVDKAAVIRGDRYSATVRAESVCVIVVVPRDALLDLLDRERGVRQHVLGHLAGQVRAHEDRLTVTALGGGVERVAAWLLSGVDAGTIVLPGSQEALARELGLSRVTVNRALKRLERSGIVRVGRGQVEVCSAGGLRELAG